MSVRILCVEDNERNMRLVRKFLEHAGYTVLEASDGLTALDIATSEHPDLILMDVNLPDIHGLEATMRLKSDQSLAHIPVIALTANAMHGDRERCLEAGCDDYLSKPIDRTALLQSVGAFFPQGQGE